MLLSLRQTCLSQESCWLIVICCCRDFLRSGVLLHAPEFRNSFLEAGEFLADFLHNGMLLLSFALWCAATLLPKLQWQDMPCRLSVLATAYSLDLSIPCYMYSP